MTSQAEKNFQQRFGRPPRWIARAPGRVNLMGEHTDYNEGYVLPMALERDTLVLAAPNDSSMMTWVSTAMGNEMSLDLAGRIEAGPPNRWTNYPLGVVAGFIRVGRTPSGFDALVHSTVAIGGGISSSAALTVATATLLEAMLGEQLDPVEKALLCQKAEHEYAGVPCGVMDQFIATLGQEDHLLLLDCRSHEGVQIRFADSGVAILIINSHVKHHLGASEYPVRHAQCEAAVQHFNASALRDVTREQLEQARNELDPLIFRRARHVIGEIDRALQMADNIRDRNWESAGRLMYQSHESLQRDFEVSCPELDAIVRIARNIGTKGGIYGCRMTGGGFGGCAVALIESASEPEITRALGQQYSEATRRTATIFSSRPARGASLLIPGELR